MSDKKYLVKAIKFIEDKEGKHYPIQCDIQLILKEDGKVSLREV